jgi:hypothetical protein
MDFERDREKLSTRGFGGGTRGRTNFGAFRAVTASSVSKRSYRYGMFELQGARLSVRSREGRADALTYVEWGCGWVGRLWWMAELDGAC